MAQENKKSRMLLAEDNYGWAREVMESLEGRFDVEIDHVHDAQSLFDMARANQGSYDLILTDNDMGRRDPTGYDAIGWIREHDQTTPIYLNSSHLPQDPTASGATGAFRKSDVDFDAAPFTQYLARKEGM